MICGTHAVEIYKFQRYDTVLSGKYYRRFGGIHSLQIQTRNKGFASKHQQPLVTLHHTHKIQTMCPVQTPVTTLYYSVITQKLKTISLYPVQTLVTIYGLHCVAAHKIDVIGLSSWCMCRVFCRILLYLAHRCIVCVNSNCFL
jgi:hypothetical protein